MSNIIVRARYQISNTGSKSISKWMGYVSQKDKADGVSLNDINKYDNFYSLINPESDLYETRESFIWNASGDINPKYELKKNKNTSENSLVWNLVISFPSNFALENGLVTKSDYFDLTKNIVPSLITDMGLKIDNTLWYASLHRNTKNPHMHILFSEKNTTMSRGIIPRFVINKLKSNIGNYLIDNKEFYRLRDQEFFNISGGVSFLELAKIKKYKLYSDLFRRMLNKKLLNLYVKLPQKGRLQYNSKNINFVKNDLNEIIEFILLHDSVKYDYANYIKLLEKHQRDLNALYGMTDDNKNKKYYNDQITRLYTRIGNDILNNFKIYQSQDLMQKETHFITKHILDMNFRSNKNYIKDETKISVAKDLYKICSLANLDYNQTKEVFKNWLKNSKYDFNVEDLLSITSTIDVELSSDDYYKSLRRLGYDYKRYNKLKERHFYKEVNYKIFMNRAFNHLLYEYEKEEKLLVDNIRFDLDGY